MPSRSVRRRQHKRLARLHELTSSERHAEAVRLLLDWRREARSRARSLDAPPVWELATAPSIQAVAAELAPGGELQADLNRVCAEAVAGEAGALFLVRGSRPLADRGRLLKTPTPAPVTVVRAKWK
jgi:hypothetical protein